MVERWLPVVGYEGIYEVSSLGRVRRVTRGPHTRPGLILKATVEKRGYHVNGLTRDGRTRQFRTARLVAEAFLGVRAGMQANHISGHKDDDRIENLGWATAEENIHHAVKTGLMRPARGARHWRTRLTNMDVVAIRERARLGESHAEIARAYGVSRTCVSLIVERIAWKHLDPP